MTSEELISLCENSITSNGYVHIADADLATLDSATVGDALNRFGMHALLHLPAYEVSFFEWLRTEDVDVWRDLWEDDTRAPYLVSMAYLPVFLGERPGVFAIRDLRSQDNYYFAPDMLLEKESAAYLDAVKERFLRGESLSAAQLIAMEVSLGPVDIWHMSYGTKIPIATLKLAVRQLVEDRILVHVPDADHLSSIFDIQ